MAEYINETEVLRRALYTYGSFLQIAVMMEEMSELQKRTMLNTSRCGVTHRVAVLHIALRCYRCA